jgi:hypothetical protein
MIDNAWNALLAVKGCDDTKVYISTIAKFIYNDATQLINSLSTYFSNKNLIKPLNTAKKYAMFCRDKQIAFYRIVPKNEEFSCKQSCTLQDSKHGKKKLGHAYCINITL